MRKTHLRHFPLNIATERDDQVKSERVRIKLKDNQNLKSKIKFQSIFYYSEFETYTDLRTVQVIKNGMGTLRKFYFLIDGKLWEHRNTQN